ncbi:cytochrome c3 family protein [Roseimaritima sediminicola]|uniref:cytochrome c3 family protein n=1 Tax=Roseimaritima sediminicola TaxID=2662066 RepID=UPI0013866FD2|nr:cytochrome c3 family protein [Roseimaritima sediminicola]
MRRQEIDSPQPPQTDRPSDRWVCGHADQGHPCAHGPNPDGGCPATGACRPVEGRRGYRCGRPACLGGPCDRGPDADGTCALTPTPCVPRRSWHSRRTRAIVAGVLAAVAVLGLMIAVPWQSEPLRPGPLHRSHAQILGSQLAADRCAACHPAAQGGLVNWFVAAGAQHAGISQSQLCIDCHHGQIEPETALLAHNLTAAQLHRISRDNSLGDRSWHDSLPSPAFAANSVQCSACHREHQGPNHDLTALTNQQCQTCHQDRFASFADGHPEWTDWPYRRPGRIAFDHAAHARKHFPESLQDGVAPKFDCRACHQRTAEGEITASGSFQQTCASCHESTLAVESAQALDLFAVPALAQPPAGATHWPEAALGFYDGRIGPLTEWLLAADPEVQSALERLPAQRDFAKVNAASKTQVTAAEQVALAIDRLAKALAEDSDRTIRQRLGASGVGDDAAGRVAAQLSPQLLYDSAKRWFAESGGAAAAPWHLPEFDPQTQLPSGGWYRDDLTLAVRYRGQGHGDPLLVGLIEAAAELPKDSPLAQRMWQHRAVAACLQCHQRPVGADAFRWQAEPEEPQPRPFTRFSHRPHLKLPILDDCTHCHQIAGGDAEVQWASTTPGSHDFRPLPKASCAACHNATAASDNCTQCHNYHVGQSSLSLRRE